MSETERRQLSEIGEDRRRDDLHLAQALSVSGAVGFRQLIRVGYGLTTASLALEVGGALARQPLVCAIAWLVAILSLSILLLTPRPSAPPGNPR